MLVFSVVCAFETLVFLLTCLLLFSAMAAEFVGGAIVNSIIEVLVDKLASTEMMDYFRTKLDENLLKKLNNSLISINAVVQDAEQQQIRRPTVKEWICNVKDAMMDAEDVLDEIYIQNSNNEGHSFRNQWFIP